MKIVTSKPRRQLQLPELFQTSPLDIKGLQNLYVSSNLEFWKRILVLLGYVFQNEKQSREFVEKLMRSALPLYITLGEAQPLPIELAERITIPDFSGIERAFRKSGFRSWESFLDDLYSDFEFRRTYRYEAQELRFCLVLDMIFTVLSNSDRPILGTAKKEAAVDCMLDDFSYHDDFADMIETQLGITETGKKPAFCRHRHYFAMAESTLNVRETYYDIFNMEEKSSKRESRAQKLLKLPAEELLRPYRFPSDEKWTETSIAGKMKPEWTVNQQPGGQNKEEPIDIRLSGNVASLIMKRWGTGQLLLHMLPEYFRDISEESVRPAKDALSYFSVFAGTNGGSKRRQANLRNKPVNRESLGLYQQMPYLYIAEWLIINRRRTAGCGITELCPLIHPCELEDYASLGAEFAKRKDSWRINHVKKRMFCSINSDFDENAATLNDIKAFAAAGSNVTITERRITQYCFFQYIATCIEKFGRLAGMAGAAASQVLSQDMAVPGREPAEGEERKTLSTAKTGPGTPEKARERSKAAGAESEAKNVLTDTRKKEIFPPEDGITQVMEEFLTELFRMQYLVRKSKLFIGFYNHLKRQLAAAYGDSGFTKVLGDTRRSFFWNTYIMFLRDKAGTGRITAKELKDAVKQYNSAMESAREGDRKFIAELLQELGEIRRDAPFYDFGMDFLSYTKDKLCTLLKDPALNSAGWDELDVTLKEEYTGARIPKRKG